jgi:hypothetical protein
MELIYCHHAGAVETRSTLIDEAMSNSRQVEGVRGARIHVHRG